MFRFARAPFVAALLIAALAASRAVLGFALMGDSWPAGSDIVMHLSLSRSSSGFQDGSASWNASAADALRIWNEHLQTVRFVEAGSVASGNGDGQNSVFFSSSIYGESFGDRTIAVTVGFNDASDQTRIVETDVIFNSAKQWNSYRGPLQYGSGGTPMFDLRRVALHEFGHVLGLDHPDAKGQVVHALMNSQADDNDALTADDIAGAQHLYGVPSLRAPLGDDFQHQPRGSAGATNFTAEGLPPGLVIDPASGLISGIPNISGTFAVVIHAMSPSGPVTLRMTIHVTVPPPEAVGGSSVRFLTSLSVGATRFLADPKRPRIYFTDQWAHSVSVLDMTSLTVTKTIAMEKGPSGLTISEDGSKLYISHTQHVVLGVVDLATLERLPNVPASYGIHDVQSGPAGRLYVASGGGIAAVDEQTGATVTPDFYTGGGPFRVSPDRKSLYVSTASGDRSLRKYDISSPTPLLVQSAPSTADARDLKVSSDGTFLVAPYSASQQPYTRVASTEDLTAQVRDYITGAHGGSIALSGDGRVAYQALTLNSKVVMFEPRSQASLGEFILPKPHQTITAVETDNSGAYLLVATEDRMPPSPGQPGIVGEIAIYTTGRVNAPPGENPKPTGLANVSTRMRVAAGENTLIGGFIVQGDVEKTIIVRAVGPSLPVAGRLQDPTLELHDSAGNVLATNDNWNSTRRPVLGSGMAPSNEYEAAIVRAVSPGAYTAVVRGNSSLEGVALFEVYDRAPENSRLANISTRGRVETGDDVMIGGFIIGGDRALPVTIRALGPSLTSSGVDGPLADTTLDLHDGNGSLIATNDDWQAEEEQAVIATTVPPTNDRESAIVKTLAPGNYTAIVRGKNDTTGVALVEVYNLDSN